MKVRWRIHWNLLACIAGISLSLLCGVTVYFGVFDKLDYAITDVVTYYLQIKDENDTPISIIAIDEKTVKAYGEYDEWSRSMSAKLIEVLNAGEWKPVVIGMDLLYDKEKDEKGDKAFVEACKTAGNVCLIVKPNVNEGMKEAEMAFPYTALREVVQIGGGDGLLSHREDTVRQLALRIETGKEMMDSFPVVLYKKYQEHIGKAANINLDLGMNMQFDYSRKTNEYDTYSFWDVVNGKVDSKVFENRIVIVGDYTRDQILKVPYMQGGTMQEAAVQANMVDALLSQKVIHRVSNELVAVLYTLFIFACNYIRFGMKKKRSIPITMIMLYVHFHMWFFLREYYYFPIVPLWIFVVLSLIVGFMILLYRESQSKEQMQKALETYVEHEIVEHILKDEYFEIQLGGMKKDIAVLFVDIRGFTSISEVLEPEEVVNILNEYLELIARAVIKNKGTLDKFIGDAAMAIYNAPDDLEDYVFKAIQTGWDIVQGAKALKNETLKRHGVEVSFGIGIHCGTAIVGNIGCECRMDYTAIGDVVNTASRLEGKALRDQILISQDVYDLIQDRVITSYVGKMVLKGKKKEIDAYEVLSIIGEEVMKE